MGDRWALLVSQLENYLDLTTTWPSPSLSVTHEIFTDESKSHLYTSSIPPITID